MPIYDYRCEDCSARYEVYHKGRELAEDVVCPKCQSQKHKKVMSVPAAAVMGSASPGASSTRAPEGCDNAGGCGCGAGGSCGLN